MDFPFLLYDCILLINRKQISVQSLNKDQFLPLLTTVLSALYTSVVLLCQSSMCNCCKAGRWWVVLQFDQVSLSLS